MQFDRKKKWGVWCTIFHYYQKRFQSFSWGWVYGTQPDFNLKSDLEKHNITNLPFKKKKKKKLLLDDYHVSQNEAMKVVTPYCSKSKTNQIKSIYRHRVFLTYFPNIRKLHRSQKNSFFVFVCLFVSCLFFVCLFVFINNR